MQSVIEVLEKRAGLPSDDAAAVAAAVEGAMREEIMREAWASGGTTCKCCGQRADVRRVSITPIQLETLAIAYHEVEGDTSMFVHVPSMVHESASRSVTDFAVMRGFGIVEPLELTKSHEDTSRLGLYRLTELGVRFLRGGAAIPRSVRVYNGEVLQVAEATVTASDVWGKPFDIDAAVIRACAPKRGILAAA